MKLRPFLICSLAIVLTQTSQASLIALYRFNETTGNTAADSIRGAPGAGTLNNFGGAQWIPGKIGNALDFDGVDDFALAANAITTGMTSFTISAWVWADAAPVWGTIVKNWGSGLSGAFHLGFDNATGRISNYLSAPQDGPVSDPAVLGLNAWHHVALTYNGSITNQSLYIDGLLVGSRNTAPADVDALGINMSFGVKTNDTTTVPAASAAGFWNGRLDDIGIWNEALSPAQISQIKLNGDAGIGIIPEPGTCGLLVFAMAGLLRRRR